VGRHTPQPDTLNTGSPPGLRPHPLLYYTHDCVARFSSNTIVKFADLTWTTHIDTGEEGKATPLPAQAAEEVLLAHPSDLQRWGGVEHPDRKHHCLVRQQLLSGGSAEGSLTEQTIGTTLPTLQDLCRASAIQGVGWDHLPPYSKGGWRHGGTAMFGLHQRSEQPNHTSPHRG